MAAMTTKQKDATRKFMLQEIARLTELESKMFVMRAVTHLPWANRNHASGILSDLAKKGELLCEKGRVRRKMSAEEI